MWWRRTTATLLGASFGSYRRLRRDVLMGRSGYVPLRRLGDVPLRRRWVFHLRPTCDVSGTYKETSLGHRHDVLLPGGIPLKQWQVVTGEKLGRGFLF